MENLVESHAEHYATLRISIERQLSGIANVSEMFNEMEVYQQVLEVN